MARNAELVVIIRTEENEKDEVELWRFERDIKAEDVAEHVRWFKSLLSA
jgi:hypothetical protein